MEKVAFQTVDPFDRVSFWLIGDVPTARSLEMDPQIKP